MSAAVQAPVRTGPPAPPPEDDDLRRRLNRVFAISTTVCGVHIVYHLWMLLR